jgi:hypothetical protein
MTIEKGPGLLPAFGGWRSPDAAQRAARLRRGALLIRGLFCGDVQVPALRRGTSAPHRVRDRLGPQFNDARFGGEAGHDLISVS